MGPGWDHRPKRPIMGPWAQTIYVGPWPQGIHNGPMGPNDICGSMAPKNPYALFLITSRRPIRTSSESNEHPKSDEKQARLMKVRSNTSTSVPTVYRPYVHIYVSLSLYIYIYIYVYICIYSELRMYVCKPPWLQSHTLRPRARYRVALESEMERSKGHVLQDGFEVTLSAGSFVRCLAFRARSGRSRRR
jgi:hypothetical protein